MRCEETWKYYTRDCHRWTRCFQKYLTYSLSDTRVAIQIYVFCYLFGATVTCRRIIYVRMCSVTVGWILRIFTNVNQRYYCARGRVYYDENTRTRVLHWLATMWLRTNAFPFQRFLCSGHRRVSRGFTSISTKCFFALRFTTFYLYVPWNDTKKT